MRSDPRSKPSPDSTDPKFDSKPAVRGAYRASNRASNPASNRASNRASVPARGFKAIAIGAAFVALGTVGSVTLAAAATPHATHGNSDLPAAPPAAHAMPAAQSTRDGLPGLPRGALPASADESSVSAGPGGRWLRITLPEPQSLDLLAQPAEDSPT